MKAKLTRFALVIGVLATVAFAAGAPRVAGFCFGGGC
jgi:hypothetical protein